MVGLRGGGGGLAVLRLWFLSPSPPEWGLSEAHLSHGATIGKGEFGEVLTGTYRDMQVSGHFHF